MTIARRARPRGAGSWAGSEVTKGCRHDTVLPRRFGLDTLRFKSKIRVLYVTRTAMPTAKGIRVNDTLDRLRPSTARSCSERASDVSLGDTDLRAARQGRARDAVLRQRAEDLPDRHRAAARGRLLRGLRLARGGPAARLRGAAAAACTRSCSCSTWRLSCCSERRRCPRTVRAARLSAIQPQSPEPGDAVLEPQLDARGAAALADPPAAALVDAGHGVPGEVALRLELDDLDQAADLGRADPQQHPVAGAEPGLLLALDRPARDAGHEVQVARRVGDVRPTRARAAR